MKKLILFALVFICQIIFSQEKVLVKKLSYTSRVSVTITDTIKTSFADTSFTVKSVNAKTILLETFLSPFMGALFSLPSAIFVGARALTGNEGNYDYLTIYLTYVLGTSTCVYMLADDFNPLTSFWRIFASGVIGAGIGAVIIESKGDLNLNGWESAIILSLPILCEVVYANLINPKPVPHFVESTEYTNYKMNNNSYKDIYNSTMLFKAEVFRINF